MGKYAYQVTEEAYELLMIQGLKVREVVRRMREKHPTFCWRTLSKWKKDKELDWEGRHREHCKATAKKADADRVKKFTSIISAVKEVREETYLKLVTILKKDASITEKNLGLVMNAFTRLIDLEIKLTGKQQTETPIKQVVYIILMALEKNPTVGPMIVAHKKEIEEAIFEEIQSGK